MLRDRWCWLLLLLFGLRSAWVLAAALAEPVWLAGDFATDYLPRARYLAEFGVFPAASQLALDMYLRPPGYSLLLWPFAALGLGDQAMVLAARGVNVLAEALCILLLLGWLWRQQAPHMLRLLWCLGVLAQPFTLGQVLLPAPDTLLMLLYLLAAVSLLAIDGVTRVRFALQLGLACGLSLLLRIEMVVLVAIPLALAIWQARHGRRVLLLFILGPAVLAAASIAGYGQHVQGRWNVWDSGSNRFAGHPVTVWVRSWCGSEQEKTPIAWYWYRGEQLAIDVVPAQALASAEERQIVEGVLANGRVAGAVDERIGWPLAELAQGRREQESWRFHLGIPICHAWAMWRDSPAPGFWSTAVHRLNWRAPALLLGAAWVVLVAGLVLALVGAGRRSGCRWPLVVLGIPLAARTGLFALTVALPESRYMLPCWPLLLMLCCSGYLNLVPRRGHDRPERRFFGAG